MKYKLLLFDLDGTLLKSDKSISANTLNILTACKNNGFLIGISTSRSEKNSLMYISELEPDIIISSGGAAVKYRNSYIFTSQFSATETQNIIQTAKSIVGQNCEITADTLDTHYWNYKTDPSQIDKNWGESIYTDFSCFEQEALKICVEIKNDDLAIKLSQALGDYDCIRFSDGYWYKFTKKNITKENAISEICRNLGLPPESIIAFGDDYADIGMLKYCGRGVAMGNAVAEVKTIADEIIGTNDEDGIAEYILKNLL